MLENWKKKASHQVADCRVFKLREDSYEDSVSAKEASFYVIENPDWVNIFALTEDEKIVLIEQFRFGTEEITLEIPGGMIDDNEEPAACAERELLEETGFSAKEIIYLGKSRPNPAIQTNWIYHFLAKNAAKTGETDFDEHENIRVKLADLSEMKNMIESEQITHSLVIAGFYRLQNFLTG